MTISTAGMAWGGAPFVYARINLRIASSRSRDHPRAVLYADSLVESSTAVKLDAFDGGFEEVVLKSQSDD